MKTCPFIGVRGFVHQSQSRGVCEVFRELARDPVRKLAIVCDVNDATIAETPQDARKRCGEYNEHARLCPPVADIPKIFVTHEWVLNFVNLSTGNHAALAENLERIVAVAGPLLNGIQLAMDWPSPGTLRAFRSAHPDLRIVLRVSRDGVRESEKKAQRIIARMNEEAGGSLSPERQAAQLQQKAEMFANAVARRVAKYAGGITDVLLNLSGSIKEGGKLFDAELMVEFLRALCRNELTRTLGFAVAGGFGAKPFSIRPVGPILREFSALSTNGAGAMVNVVNQLDASSAMGFFRNMEELCANVGE